MYIPVGTPEEEEWSPILSRLVETVNSNWMWGKQPGSFFLNGWIHKKSTDGGSWVVVIDCLQFNKAMADIQLRISTQADWSFLDPAVPVTA